MTCYSIIFLSFFLYVLLASIEKNKKYIVTHDCYYLHILFYFNYFGFFPLDFDMSSDAHQTSALNKKQRRKNARTNLQSTRPPDDEHDEIVQTQPIILTQNIHLQVNDVSLTTNGIQGLVLNGNEQVEKV